MRKQKRLAEEERRYLAARAKRQRKNSLQGAILVTSHGERPLVMDNGSAAVDGYSGCRAVLTRE
jgi:hypothetical protein